MNRAYLSIGSNVRPEHNLRTCVALLRERCDSVFGVITSPVYKSISVLNLDDNDNTLRPYYNLAAVVETELSPNSLKDRVLKDIENQLGRVRPSHNVTIDIDIVLFNNERLQVGKREIPDPAIYEHAYLALPLADVAPDYVHPLTGESLRDIAARFDNIPGVIRREDIQL
jgi:2-amino-4-hydroxy-6-hydroxymethyldihydropteridine diphosphokinase